MSKTQKKMMAVVCLMGGSVLTYLAGHDIHWGAGLVPLVAYTVGVFTIGAGIRGVLKG